MRMYFLTAIRSLRKRLGYTVLNVLGLTLGIATCLTIFLVVRYEFNYDAFNHLANRTYRVTRGASDASGGGFGSSLSLAVAPRLRVDFPELQAVSQVWYRDGSKTLATVQVGNSKYEERQLAFADGELPKVLDYGWLKGDARTALVAPGSVVLTETIAKKYFGSGEAMGKTILVDEEAFKVTGVIRDLPGNTTLPVKFLFSFSTVAQQLGTNDFGSTWSGSFLYVVLPPNVSVQQVQGRMHAFVEKNWGKDAAKDFSFLLQPLRDIHFDQRYGQSEVYATTSRQTYWALGGIAVFIVIIACINFINLSTGLAVTRAREVGVRKVLGASRPQLIAQFMGETAVLVVVSVGLGLLAASLLLPSVNSWLDIRLDVAELVEPRVLGLLAGVTVGVILLAGLYPSFVQSAFQPVVSLKGQGGTRRRGFTLRKGLVVVQFSISQLLIIGTIVVARQMDFFQNQDLGFNKESVVSFYLPEKKMNLAMEQAMASTPGVSGYCLDASSPVDNRFFTGFYSAELGMTRGDEVEMKIVDERYVRMFGLKMVAGDTIAPRPGHDSVRRTVINQTMMEKLHLRPDNAVGKRYQLADGNAVIIGVVADFQSGSKHNKRGAAVLFYDSSMFSQLCVKLRPREVRRSLASIRQSWSTLYPDGLFKYQFLDDQIAARYRQEQKVYTAVRLFAGIAILIGCLGLYGLVAFAAVQRTKEVGVRKVLGASMGDIVFLFSREFVVLIGIAFVIAAPVAWMVM
ncbi:MAG TPA: ABC transporter permease, partial [Puia sp.]